MARDEGLLSFFATGRKGHFALTDQVKFAAEKQPPRFESSGPAKTIDEEGIDLLIGSL